MTETTDREFKPTQPGYPGTLVTLTGRPGCGKTTVIEKLTEMSTPECPIGLFDGKSVTTRVPRADDRLDEYIQKTDEEFDEMEERGDFLWTVPNSGYRFGTLRSAIDEALQMRKVSVLNLVPQVIEKLHNYAGPANVLSFFIRGGGTAILERRMEKRGSEDAERIKRRLRETDDWCPEMYYGFMTISNPNEEPQGLTAAREIVRILRGRNCI